MLFENQYGSVSFGKLCTKQKLIKFMIIFSTLSEVYPFVSLFFSLILFLGLYAIGELLFFNKQIQSIFLNISELRYQNILVAVNFLMFILFPVVLFSQFSKEILNFFSIAIFLLGVWKFYFVAKKKIKIEIQIQRLNFEKIVCFLLLLGFFLIALSPVNHADSLDYHMTGAIHIFKTGKLPTTLENFHNLLVSGGEVIYSLSFFFGAEQFGTLVQFSGLLSLVGIIKKFKSKNNVFFILLILSSPVLLFLATTPKPQLFHISSNAIIFVLLFINFSNTIIVKKSFLSLIFVVNIFLINSINAKFSFILSSFILYILLLIFAQKKNFLLQTVLTSFLLLFFFYLCFPYWKSTIWGTGFHNYLISPFPEHLEGVKFFKNYLINYSRESSLIYLFIPKSLGQFTDALGIGSLIIVYFFLRKEIIFIYFAIIFFFFIIVNYFLGQPTPRFFIELYIWSVLLIASLRVLNIERKFSAVFYPQFVLSTFALWYGVFTMSYGSINLNLKNFVMNNTANGYSLFNWSNEFVSKQDTVISMHRSIFLGKANTISTDFLNYNNPNGGILHSYHLKNIINKTNETGSTYLLTFGSKENVDIFIDCIDFLYKEKKDVGRLVGRNPFNKSSYYNGYLFKLKDIKRSKCLKFIK